MIPLIFTILCSTSIAFILKHNDNKKGNPVILLSANYFVASLITLLFLYFGKNTSYSIETLLFGAVLAFMFIFSFFVFAKAVSIAGAALASVSSRLSVIIPILLSIVIYREIPFFKQVIGFLFALTTILFFYFSLKKMSNGHLKLIEYSYLFLLLIGIGLNDSCLKVFQEWRPESEKSFFLFSIFTFSFLYTLTFILIKKIKVEKRTIFFGIVLGIPNIFSSYFLLGALSKLPAIFVYPVSNIGIILLTTIGAALIWKEKLNTYGKVALLFGVVSILFLSL